MGTDSRSREEIARQAEEVIYRTFVRNLIFLATVTEIRESVATMSGLHPLTLECVIARLGTELRNEERLAELELLEYVRTLIASFLTIPASEAPIITGAHSLITFLLQTKSVMRMRTALVSHSELVNEDLYNAAAELMAHRRTAPSKEHCLAVYLIARLMNDHKKMVRGLLLWGAFCRDSQMISHADRHFRRAAELAREQSDPISHLEIKGAQAGLYRAMNRYQDACVALEEGMKLAQNEGHTSAVASFADGLASCYRALGQTAKALDAISQLIVVADNFPGRKSRALNFRGLLYEDLGRYEIGMSDYIEAGKVASAEGDREQQFTAMTNAAASLLKRRMYRESYHAFHSVLNMVKKWGNPLMIASTYNNLGQTLSLMECYAAARTQFGKALSIKINSHDSFGEGTAFLGLGHCEEKLGDSESAQVFYAGAMLAALESQDAVLIGQTQLAIFDGKKSEGELDEDLRSLQLVLDLAREQGQSMLEDMLVTRIAVLLKKNSRIDEAIEVCRKLLKSRPLDGDLMGSVSVCVEYSRLLATRQGSWNESVALLLERLAVSKKQMSETLIDARLGEIAGLTRPVYGALFELLCMPYAAEIDGYSPAELGFDLLESAKARSLLAHLADAAALSPSTDVPIELRQMESALLAKERKWQEEKVPSEGQRYEKLGEIREQLKDCWHRMKPISPDYVRDRSAEPYTYREILETLRATTTGKTALISFFVGAESTTCFILSGSHNNPIMLSIPLGETDLKLASRQLQRTFNGDLDEFPPYPPIRGDMPFKRRFDFLDRLSSAFSPLFACLDGVELICVAPHGPLHTIPLHALQLPDGKYLSEKYAVVYTPSLSIALSKARRTPIAQSFGGVKSQVFVAGVSSADDVYPEHFEGDDMLFDSAYWKLHTAMGVQDANREAVISGLKGNRVVHISCHAFFNGRNPQNSGLILTNGRVKAPRDLSQLSFIERQSYLVTVRDLMRISLGAELVTLSACSTGLQRDRNGGDEMEGFARALLGAGADSALLTMWNVDQSSSRKLLSKFYCNWSELGMPKWKALQVAQQEMIRSDGNLSHPYHWAPFCLIGSWR